MSNVSRPNCQKVSNEDRKTTQSFFTSHMNGDVVADKLKKGELLQVI